MECDCIQSAQDDGLTNAHGLTKLLHLALQQRDPGRTFVLGERLSYVLLPGARTQDAAAEDPLAAAKAGCSANYELYWQNKLRKPLAETLATCLSTSQIQVRHGSDSFGIC